MRTASTTAAPLLLPFFAAAPTALAQSAAPGAYFEGEIVLGVAYAARPVEVDRALAAAGVAVLHARRMPDRPRDALGTPPSAAPPGCDWSRAPRPRPHSL